MKFTRFILLVAVSISILFWFVFVAVRHADGDIIFTSELGWDMPQLREVRYFLPRGDAISETKAQRYWFGGDVIYEGAPKWVLLLPCPKWIGSVGGNWYGAIDGYSRWVPSI
jgi:hypothetical protein